MPRTATLRTAAVVMVSALIAAACSGGSSDGGDDATSTTVDTAGTVDVDLTALPADGTPADTATRAFDQKFLDLLWEGTGAGKELATSAREALFAAYSAVNTEAKAAASTPQGGPSRPTHVPTVRQSDAAGGFSGFLEQLGSNFSRFEQQLKSGTSGSQSATFDKTIEVPGKDGGRDVADVALTVTYSLVGSKATVRGTLKGELRSLGKSGETQATFAVELRAEASVTLCPDLDGMARVEGTFTGSGNFGGNGLRGTVELSSSGTVGDDAYLSGVEWRSRGRLEYLGSTPEFVEIGMTGSSRISNGTVESFGKSPSVGVTDSDFAGAALLGETDRVVLAQYVATELLGSIALNFAQSMWRDGFCLEIRTTEESGTVDPGETVQFTATVWHKFDAREEDHPIRGFLRGEKELTPKDEPQDPPVLFRYLAPETSGGKHSANLSSVSRRGIAYKQLDFEVGKPGYRLEAAEYARGYVNPKGGTCDLAKPWSMSLDIEGGFLQLAFAMTPGGADGLTGSVRVTASVVDSDFKAVANSQYRILPVPEDLGAPDGAQFFEWGPAPLVPLVPGGMPLTIPALKYLLVPDNTPCS